MCPALRSLLPLLIGLMLAAATQPAAPVAAALSEHQRHDLRCAAAFAVIGVAQTRGDSAALALPRLEIRGKRYLGLVGEHVAGETGLSGAAVRDLLTDAANAVVHDGATGVATACLADLDRVVPPRPAPDVVTCFALLDVYADVLAARETGNPLGQTLAHAAATLRPFADDLLRSRGLDRTGEVAAIAQRRAQLREALGGGPAVIDADDFAQCRAMAAARGG